LGSRACAPWEGAGRVSRVRTGAERQRSAVGFRRLRYSAGAYVGDDYFRGVVFQGFSDDPAGVDRRAVDGAAEEVLGGVKRQWLSR